MCQPIRLAAFALTFTLLLAGIAHGEEPADLVLILDASGSMWGQIDGENKIVIARRVLAELIDGLPGDGDVGLVAYGHRREGDCDDIETVVSLGPLDRGALKDTVDGLNPRGKTPITKSVQAAFDVVRGRDGGATVILVSDGLETCGGDPCAAVRAAKEQGIDFILHVVGFDVAGEDTSQLECAAQAGDGMFLSAENADQLGEALDAAVAMSVDVPAGRLSVKAIANGELHDAAVHVTFADSGEEAGGGRTYASPDTNPRRVPLADGRYHVKVQAVGIKGDVHRHFEGIEIKDGSTVEKVVDFSTGELVIGVLRNGELSDATVNVHVAGTGERVAGGRTYTAPPNNPKVIEITAGTYDVVVKSVEIAGAPSHAFEAVVVEPQGRVEVRHEYQSGSLTVGVVRGSELVDATLSVRYADSGQQAAGGRTYAQASSNPKTFVLEPGEYTVEVREIRGDQQDFTVTVEAGSAVERIVDLDADD